MSDSRTIERPRGGTVAYEVHGSGTGQTVLLVHGLAAGRRQFDADARHFASKGYRVVVPDLRGHGDSRLPLGFEPEDLTRKAMADDLLAVLDHAGVDEVHWVGNSLGGILALELLSRGEHPIRTLTTFGTVYAMGLPDIAPFGFPILYGLLGKEWTARLTAMMTTPRPEARELVESLVSDFDPDVGRMIAGDLCRYDYRVAAIDFKGPILLIKGGKDGVVNMGLSDTLSLMSSRPNFTSVTLSRLGHCANLDDPEAFRDVVERFWAQTGTDS